MKENFSLRILLIKVFKTEMNIFSGVDSLLEIRGILFMC